MIHSSKIKILIDAGKSAKKILGPPQGIIAQKAGRRTCGMALKAVMKISSEGKHSGITTGTTGYCCIILKDFLWLSDGDYLYNCNFPYLSDLLSVFKEKDRSYTEKKEKIDLLKNLTDITGRHFEILSKNPDSKTLVKEKGNIHEFISRYKDCLLDLEKSIKPPSEESIEKCLNTIVNISKNIFTSLRLLKEAEEVIYHHHCINCGYSNNPQRKYCKNCSSPIQRFSEHVNPENRSIIEEFSSEDTKRSFTILTYNISSIITAIEEYQKAGKHNRDFTAGKEAFRKAIEKFSSVFEPERHEIEKYKNEILQETGIEEISKGLDLLKEDFLKERKVNMGKGLNLIIEGAGKLYNLQKSGEEAERVLYRL